MKTLIDFPASFLKIQSVGTAGEQVINYSDRFTLSGMTGTFPVNVQNGIKKVSGTDGPPSTAQDAPAAGAGAGGAEGDYAISYTAQTGLIKYAPMQTPPGTKITANKVSQRYPTSSVQIATTFLPTPKQTTTMTASQTITHSSQAFQVRPLVAHAVELMLTSNQAPAASMPQDDMQKFLMRWRD